MIRVLSVLSVIVLIAGIVVIFTGGLGLALVLILLGLGGLALAFAVSEAKRLYSSARDWVRLFAEGRPRSLRLVSVEAPKGFVLNPDATVTLEAESRTGVVKQHTQGVPVPRLYAFFWKLATWLRIPLPKRLDFERMVRLQLRRAKERAAPETAPPAPPPTSSSASS